MNMQYPFQKKIEAFLLKKLSLPIKIGISSTVLLLYLVFFTVLQPYFGLGTAILVVGPIAVIAWMGGVTAGIISGILSFPLNYGLMVLFHLDPNGHFLTFGLLGTGLFTMVGSSVGLVKTLLVQIESLNSEKDMFLGIAAHDLRNPLGTVIESTSLIKEGIVEKEAEVTLFLGIILTAAKDMKVLIDELLTINNIKSKPLDVQTASVNVHELVDQIVIFNRLQAEKKKISIQSEVHVQDSHLVISEKRVNQVMNNLINNAIKYSPESSNIHLKVEKTPSNLIRWSVQDEGPGIPSSEHSQIFRAFGKISTKPTGGETKTGLGLSICKQIVEAMGGTIGFESVEGKGSVFYFDL